MSYYNNQLSEEESKQRGIDYDLEACLEYNPQNTFAVEDIERVLAVWEGENDEDDWRWILLLKDSRYVFLQGGCDYTGWDCQSWATHDFANTPEEAVNFALGSVEIKDSHPVNAGLGHMLSIMSGEYLSNAQEVWISLTNQIAEGKSRTWKEQKDDEFGNPPQVNL